MNFVIVAGGLGSRLAPLTNNIPKFLVNIGKNTGYVEIIRYWAKQTNLAEGSLTVIVNSEYAALVAEYHRLYFPELQLIVKTVTKANGSAHAILSTCEHLAGKPVMFSWCDVIPVDAIPAADLDELYDGANIVFTNYNNSNRYDVDRETARSSFMKVVLSPTERGGCFGLYYVKNFRTNDVTFNDGQDFIEILSQYGKIREHRLEKIIDFGDLPKLRRTQEFADEAREFNSVEFVGDYVLKQATNEQGKIILKRELAWYSRLDELIELHHARPSVPRTWIASDKTGFFMERAEGEPIWKAWHDLSPVDRSFVLEQLIEQRRMLYSLDRQSTQLSTVLRDVKIEAHTKLLARYNEINGVIEAFGPVKNVNGHQLQESDPTITIQRLYDALEKHYAAWPVPEYGFVHGDLQLSNSLVDLHTRRITIIDPRGYFGKSELLGLEDYDIGKLLYALSGYDSFNSSREFFITLEGGSLHFDIPHPSHDGIQEIMNDHFKPVHYGWLAVNFLGLAQYIRNDPVKSMAAHYHGLAMAEKWLASLQ